MTMDDFISKVDVFDAIIRVEKLEESHSYHNDPLGNKMWGMANYAKNCMLEYLDVNPWELNRYREEKQKTYKQLEFNYE